jgi:hypothetical protein
MTSAEGAKGAAYPGDLLAKKRWLQNDVTVDDKLLREDGPAPFGVLRRSLGALDASRHVAWCVTGEASAVKTEGAHALDKAAS